MEPSRKNITHWLGNKLAHACHSTAPEIKIIIVLVAIVQIRMNAVSLMILND